jgi:hypothetical protein
MADKLNPQEYVITDGDEGVQINEGTRLGFAGAGLQLPGFEQAVAILKEILPREIRLASTSQSAWMKAKLELEEWEQVDAMAQQKLQALADKVGVMYAGFLPFEDPQEIQHGIKGHMVRPPGIHLANKICFTFGGGEKKYNLGQYLISADWVSEAKTDLVETCLNEQVDFYRSMTKTDLQLVYQMGGVLDEEKAQANKKVVEDLGFELTDRVDQE